MRSQTAAATGFAAVAITITIASVSASSPAPVSLEPGELCVLNPYSLILSCFLGNLTLSFRLGIDGIWSTVRIAIGSPSQYVNVLPSTSLSELWTVGPGGCLESMSTLFSFLAPLSAFHFTRPSLYVVRDDARLTDLTVCRGTTLH